MKLHILSIAALCVAAALPLGGCSGVAASALTSGVGAALTTGEVTSGLKEALNVGITNGITTLAKRNGYYSDLATRIGLPPEAGVITSNIAKLPAGDMLVKKVITNINDAASDAAKEAVPIFTTALTNMTISDAMNILKNKNKTAATTYFKANTKAPLKKLFGKHIDTSINKKLFSDVSAQSSWSTLTGKWNTVATSTAGRIAGLKSVNTDLGDFLTDKAVDGIYYKVGQKETEIRTKAAARTSALLKKVFAHQ